MQKIRLRNVLLPPLVLVLALLIAWKIYNTLQSGPRPGPRIGVSRTRAKMSNIESQLANFQVEFDRLPTTSEGLDALVHQPPGMSGWTHPFLDTLALDEWGHPFIYRCPGTAGALYDLYSAGSDGIFGTADDVTLDSF